MKFTELTISTPSAVIANSVCGVRILLNLADYESCTDCVNSSRLNKEYITLLGFNFVQNFGESIVFNSFTVFVLTDFAVKPEIKGGTVLCLYNIPYSPSLARAYSSLG